MDSRSFMFDLVILNVWVPDFDYQNNSLSVDVCFNETDFTIESNPEKCGEFKQGRTCEFDEYPEDLKSDLVERPLKLSVKCNVDEFIGEAEVVWPQELLDKLERENFMGFSHFDQCDLMQGGKVTGKIGIQYRLRAKCDCSELDEDVVKRCDIQNEIKRIVNPNELFFLIQNDSDACSMTNIYNDQQPPCPTALDLSKFKGFHGQIVRDPGVFDQVYSLDCCHTKKYPTTDCKPNLCSNTPAPPCSCGKGLTKFGEESKSSMQWACKATQHVRECPHSNKFSDETGSCSCEYGNEQGNGAAPNSEVFANGKMKNICSYPQSPPVLTDTQYVRSKLCPVCNSDVSWLPKLAACPKCGHKPTPYEVEKPYNEHLTADQILEEWAVETPRRNTGSKTSKRNRCNCKNGKICAFCKIRKLCKDVLKVKKCREPGGKTSADSTSLKEESPDQVCKSPTGTESRTYLARVFSELRDLYNLKPDMKKRGFEISATCEKSFQKSKPSKPNKVKRTASSSAQKKEPDLTKKMAPDVKAKWCRGKLYNYKAVRKYPGTLIGHKTCVSSGKSVPRNMGWLWNTDVTGNRRGWRPGAIRKPIKEIMKYFLKDYPVDSLRVSRYSRKAVVKKESEELVQKPTLHICKKNGVYIVTMRPLKDASLLKNCADPYMPMKPLQFKIVKNPLLVHASQLKKALKKHFHKCTCHKPVSQCYCRTYLDKKRLEFELNKACRQKGIPSLKDTLVLSDTSESDVEFDFGVTPPAGVIKPQIKNRPDLACHETQYNEKDWIIKPTYPMKMNKYMRPFDCSGGRVVGEGGDGGWGPGGGGGWGPGGGGGWGPGGGGGWGGRGGGGWGGRGGRGGGGWGGRGGRGGRGGWGPGGGRGSGGGGGGPGGWGPCDGGGGFARPPGPEGVTMALGGNVGGGGTGAVGSGGVGGMGGVGGNTGAGRLGASAARFPLFCNLARRRKACSCCAPCSCAPCMPIC